MSFDQNSLDETSGDWSPQVCSLIIVGRSGSGKSTVGRWLAKRTGSHHLEIGRVVRADARAKGQSAIEVAADRFASGDFLDFVKRVALISTAVDAPWVVSGPRRPEEVEYLQRVLAPTLVIGLDPPEQIRLARLEARNRRDDVQSARADREAIEEAWGIAEVLRRADVRLANDGRLAKTLHSCLLKWAEADRESLV